MCTVVVTYDQKNKMAQGLMSLLSMTKGVEIEEDAIFTDEEMRRIEESRNSGILYDVDKLKEKLRS